MALAADESALISSLPGLNFKPTFRQYSGYLNASNTNRLHYWFVESQRNPSSDPILLWLNGGPGCSSLDGLLSENGPFRVQANTTLTDNPYSWNKQANVLYLEAPAGVGFSVALDGNITTDDDKVSLENYNALKDFFSKFPEFKANDFYITGESYGGIYIPTLTVRVLGDKNIKLKGIAVGNGLASYRYNEASLIYFSYYHGLFGKQTWDALLTYCNCTGKQRCFFTDANNARCKYSIASAGLALNDLNIYNLYGPCLHTSNNKAPNILEHTNLFRSNPLFTERRKLMQQDRSKYSNTKGVNLDPPCIDGTAATKYLNMPSVRAALHIPSNVQSWALCSEAVINRYHRTYQEMSEQYRTIMKSNTRILIYNGDIDMACNFLGDEWFFDDLNYPLDYSRKQWFINTDVGKQVGGVSKSWSNSKLVFTTVRGAGHMVPTDKALSASHMINYFITGRPL